MLQQQSIGCFEGYVQVRRFRIHSFLVAKCRLCGKMNPLSVILALSYAGQCVVLAALSDRDTAHGTPGISARMMDR